MSQVRTSRRAFLRGAAGTVIGLPLFEYMLNANGTAHADGTELPCRYILFFSPTSLVCSASRTDAAVPTGAGADYTTTKVLQPLADRGLKGDVSVVSGLFCPPVNAPGAYNANYHGHAYKAMLSGLRTGFDDGPWRPLGPSVDEVLARQAPADLRFRKLYYQVDPGGSGLHRIVFEGSEGAYRQVNPERSPANAYRTLFQDFTPMDTTPDPALDLDRRLRISSLSYASEQIVALNRQLSATDRRTLDEHLTQIRELERRLSIEPAPRGSACVDPIHPSTDPADLGAVPDQDARMDLFAELVQLAFACDMTRTITLAATGEFTGPGMRHPIWQSVGGLHGEVQHSSRDQNVLDDANQWFVDGYARILERLKGTSDGGAGSLLDHAAAVFMMEGGKGLTRDDQRSGDGGGDPNHSCDHMMMLVGGRAGGLAPKGHVDLSGADRHPTEVLNSAMRAVGSSSRLGEITGTVDSLFA